jgi:NAD(P)-dependent dehydrogenase (short-subunit alcohol dehydrogenase family)
MEHRICAHTVALITGASRGLGLALARAIAARGARVILTARNAADLRTAADGLGVPERVLAIPGDAGDRDHAARLVREGTVRFGAIDLLINNASDLGPTPLPPLEALPLDAFAATLWTNAVTPLHLMQLVLPGMRQRGRGTIVNVSSDAALGAYPGWGGYGASKAALDALSRVIAAEVADAGIRVYAVDPGEMDTTMHRAAEPGVDLTHLPKAEDVAPAFIALIERQPALAGRFEAQRLPRELVS